jgi:hypothetical protein
MAIESNTRVDQTLGTERGAYAERAMLGHDIGLIQAVNPDSDFLPAQVERLSTNLVVDALTTGELVLPTIDEQTIEAVSVEAAEKVLEVLANQQPDKSEVKSLQAARIFQLSAELIAVRAGWDADKLEMTTLYPESPSLLRAIQELQAQVDADRDQKIIDDGVIKMQQGVIKTQQELLQNRQPDTLKAVLARKAVEIHQSAKVSIHKTGDVVLRAFGYPLPSTK